MIIPEVAGITVLILFGAVILGFLFGLGFWTAFGFIQSMGEESDGTV